MESPSEPSSPLEPPTAPFSGGRRHSPSSSQSSSNLRHEAVSGSPLPRDTSRRLVSTWYSRPNSMGNMEDIMSANAAGNFGPYPTMSSRASYGGEASPLVKSSSKHQQLNAASSATSAIYIWDEKHDTPATAAPFVPYKDGSNNDLSDPAPLYGLYEPAGGAEDDDYLHEPTAPNLRDQALNWRGFKNILILLLVILGLLAFFAGYPIITRFTRDRSWQNVHINGTGQIPQLIGMPSLVDPMTPKEVYSRKGFDGQDYELVFSDEFETPGRSFYPGDDPFWEAVDLYYWATGDLEWYDPSQITTRDGHLVIVLEEAEDHSLQFKSGMLQSWNKVCFTTGYIEVSVVFPGSEDVSGYWPGAWIMGNLARPGYGATTDGLWPYTYDSCDVGTLKNQTNPDGTPLATATAGGNVKYNYNLSWLPGQRLSACTCPNEDHPGPASKPIGRGAPEIDIFEAQKNKEGFGGRVTQSAQMAPFSTLYYFPNTTNDLTIKNPLKTKLNSYRGSALQQAVSALTNLDGTGYADGGGEFKTYGFEYWSNPNNRQEGFIDWVAEGEEVFKAKQSTYAGDQSLGISDRLIPEEPMSIVLNLAVSESFQKVDLASMKFPAEFRIDYVRVWQRKGLKNGLTCDPPNRPTAKYINDHLLPYTNPNYTLWSGAGYSFPKNSLTTTC